MLVKLLEATAAAELALADPSLLALEAALEAATLKELEMELAAETALLEATEAEEL